jgi:Zn-dependent protease with chaperone function
MLSAGIALAAAIALAALGPLSRKALAGLGPCNRAWCAAASLAGAAGLACVSLAFLAVPAVCGLLPRSALRGWPRLSAGVGPVDLILAWFALGVLLTSVVAAAVRARRSWRERRLLLVEGGVGAHESRAGFDLVTLPGAVLVAYSLGGRSPQVVLSEGLRRQLDREAVDAVVAHEAAHLRARHDRWLLLVSLAEAVLWFMPWVGHAASAVRLSVEQWADQAAAQEVGAPALQAALLASAGIEPVPPWAAALSDTDTLAERLAMLQAPPGAGQLRLAGLTSLAAMAAAAAGGAGGLGTVLVLLAHLCGA